MLTAQLRDLRGVNGTTHMSALGPNDVLSPPALDDYGFASVAGHSWHGRCSGVLTSAITPNASLTRRRLFRPLAGAATTHLGLLNPDPFRGNDDACHVTTRRRLES